MVNWMDCVNFIVKLFIMCFVFGFFRLCKIILGIDFVGIVLEIGKNVQDFNINDCVFGFMDLGLEIQVEYMKIVFKGNLMIILDNCDFKQAAVSLEGVYYVYFFI